MRLGTIPIIAVAALCAVAVGCATPAGQYFERRGADLADCVQAEAGIGWPVAPFLFPQAGGQVMNGEGKKAWHTSVFLPKLYARAMVTDFAVVGDGFTQPVRLGWRGRYAESGSTVALASGCPIFANHEEAGGTAVHTRWLALTTRSYADEPGPRARVAERFWMGVSATLLLSARLDLNPAEFLDFLAGWFGYDLLLDDLWSPK